MTDVFHEAGHRRPRLDFRQLFNISFGFFGIQIGFALQNANMSRIFQSLGESLDDLAVLWIAAPLTGLLVQPIIGHYSDRTWGRFGRRRPYFFAGALLATLALFGMPQSQSLLMAAVLLWVLDASLNISMEPFRAFVGDMLDKDQHTAGYALQTAFIGAGAVVGSATPFVLDRLGVANTGGAGGIPGTVRYGFYFGAAALFVSVLWTVFSTREYSPAELAAFAGGTAGHDAPPVPPASTIGGYAWIGTGLVIAVLVWGAGLEKELYLLGGLVAAYGLARLAAGAMYAHGRTDTLLTNIVGDFSGMPSIMKRLALTQFFTWSALFIMWIYTTPVVAQYVYGSSDPASAAYNQAGNWVGILFAVYNGVAALAALFVLQPLARRDRQGAYPRARADDRRGGLRFVLRPAHARDAAVGGGRDRHRLGVDPRDALCDPRLRAAAGEARHLHGALQRVRRRVAAAGGDRHGHDRPPHLPDRARSGRWRSPQG